MDEFVSKFIRDVMIVLLILSIFSTCNFGGNSEINTSESCCYNPPLDTGICIDDGTNLDTSEVCL